jgi:uncharacterized protein YabE (DUF348 family)
MSDQSAIRPSSIVRRPPPAIPVWLRALLALGLIAGALVALGYGLSRTGSSLVVEIDGRPQRVRTHASTVGAALRQVGVELAAEDRVSPGLDVPLQPDSVIQVQRARPVRLSADGLTRELRSHVSTVGDLLDEAGLEIGPADEIWLNGQQVGSSALLRAEPISQQPEPQQAGSARAGSPDTRTVRPPELASLGGSSGPVGNAGLAPRQVSSRGGPRTAAESDLGVPPLIAVRRAHTLTLDKDGQTTTLHTTADTVGQVLQEQGILLFLADEVTPGLQDRIQPGMTVSIQRSMPVRIEVDGRLIHTRTRAETVAGVLGQEGVALVGKDRVEPDLAAAFRPDSTIRVTRIREGFVVEFETIPYKTRKVPDPKVEIDNLKVAQKGQVGVTKQRYRVMYENGEEVGRALEDMWTAQPPVDRVLAYGTKIVIRTLETPDGPIEYWRKMRVYTTAYTAATAGKPKDHPRYGYTRLGQLLRKGIVAVDPEVIPLKTWMYVPGYGRAKAGDTGGGVKGKFVDLGFGPGEYESWHWWTDIYLLAPAPSRDKIRWILPNWPKYPDRRR